MADEKKKMTPEEIARLRAENEAKRLAKLGKVPDSTTSVAAAPVFEPAPTSTEVIAPVAEAKASPTPGGKLSPEEVARMRAENEAKRLAKLGQSAAVSTAEATPGSAGGKLSPEEIARMRAENEAKRQAKLAGGVSAVTPTTSAAPTPATPRVAAPAAASKPVAAKPAESLNPAAAKFAAEKEAQKQRDVQIAQQGKGADARNAALRDSAKAGVPLQKPFVPSPGTPGTINRREFMSYAFGAAMGLMAAEAGVASFLFLKPRFKVGEFGGSFVLAATAVPPVNTDPVPFTDGKFWLVNVDQGVKALYKVCVHLGCLYEWSSINHRFECPCHGSRYALDGTLLHGPAARALDEFVLTATGAGKTVTTPADGAAIALPIPDAQLTVNTGKKITGRTMAPEKPNDL